HPAFPAPSWTRGRRDQAKLGWISREIGKVCKLEMHAEAPSPTATIVMHDQGRQRLIDGSRWR
ncbi:hypothetical protein, partial [Bradyrhizobium japonicum]|uniref:hypothetical protein n=1 Tax=Bradyrhizobium japonicum TaxID=375 RepID=UPI001AEC4B8C